MRTSLHALYVRFRGPVGQLTETVLQREFHAFQWGPDCTDPPLCVADHATEPYASTVRDGMTHGLSSPTQAYRTWVDGVLLRRLYDDEDLEVADRLRVTEWTRAAHTWGLSAVG